MEQSLLDKLTVPQLVKKFPHVLWNPQVHYHVHNSLSLLPIHSQITPVYILPSIFFIVHSNTNLPFTPTSSNMSFSFTFPHQNSVCISLIPHTCHMSGRSHPYAALKHAVFWRTSTEGPEDTNTSFVHQTSRCRTSVCGWDMSSHETKFTIFICSETSTLPSTNLHFPSFQAHFYWPHENFHNWDMYQIFLEYMFVLST